MQQFGRDVFVHKFQLHESGAWVRDSRRNLRWAELDQLGCRLTRIEDISAWGWLCDNVVIHSLYPMTSHIFKYNYCAFTPVILNSVLLNAAPHFFCSCCPILQVFSFKQQLRNSTHDHLGLVKILYSKTMAKNPHLIMICMLSVCYCIYLNKFIVYLLYLLYLLHLI